MADKSKAKEEMIKAGVPVVPGSKGAVHSVAEGKKLLLKLVINYGKKLLLVVVEEE